jgi:hypothetical protein
MQGVWNAGLRFKTKRELREAVEGGAGGVSLEATSFFGDEFDGYLLDAPDGEYSVVGPDPYRRRNWYATIIKHGKNFRVS